MFTLRALFLNGMIRRSGNNIKPGKMKVYKLVDNSEGQIYLMHRITFCGFANVLGLKSGSASALNKSLNSKNIGSQVPKNLRQKIDNPIVFNYSTLGPKTMGLEVHGYETETIIEVMKLLVEAQGIGIPHPHHQVASHQEEDACKISC